ncbi:MAG: ATP-binding protein [Bacteroidales bacterium]|jgi:uncharacterized protein|nr:ATP-binding protein [Bacteroidales bacterium]MDD3153138.1 ATP-binding protein [Bacteroidales bacterium]MDD3914629.1 ATP-binding protein [Bacteroidales bacterium]MDD4633802.1 ATP-binding protein [Bacteroidales bacterium]
MILEETINEVYLAQNKNVKFIKDELLRESMPSLKSVESHAIIISGVRRCGKSTLLTQLFREFNDKNIFYLNFDTPMLFDFSINDFSRLDKIILKENSQWLLFDEIQQIKGWEVYVRQKLDEHYKVIVTGSNASLLSGELVSHLTGRHISYELFPFSYYEFITFKKLQPDSSSVEQYLMKGGFPEFLKTDDNQQLITLYQDVIFRDIVARYGIKEILSLQRLSQFLIHNIGNKFSAGKLKQILSVGSTNTILNWCGFLENTYLFAFLDKFCYSVRSQMVNPKKIYSVDTGLVNAVALKSTLDKGHLFENMVYLQLRRKNRELYYFEEKNECDFVNAQNGTPTAVYQVCYELSQDNQQRELDGLQEAMRAFNLNSGTVITLNQEDSLVIDNKTIAIVPFWRKFRD